MHLKPPNTAVVEHKGSSDARCLLLVQVFDLAARSASDASTRLSDVRRTGENAPLRATGTEPFIPFTIRSTH
jgi:hypothetical protein